MDDFSLAESINLRTKLVANTLQPQPQPYHGRTNNTLPCKDSKLYQELKNTKKYADSHLMKINFTKTKLMVFNPCKTLDFQPEFEIEGHQLEVVEEVKCLGLILRSDLKWSSNTKSIVKRAYHRLWMIKRLKNLGADSVDLVDIYQKQIRSILEFGTPVWNSSITQAEVVDIERTQKSFCKLQDCIGRELFVLQACHENPWIRVIRIQKRRPIIKICTEG